MTGLCVGGPVDGQVVDWRGWEHAVEVRPGVYEMYEREWLRWIAEDELNLWRHRSVPKEEFARAAEAMLLTPLGRSLLSSPTVIVGSPQRNVLPSQGSQQDPRR